MTADEMVTFWLRRATRARKDGDHEAFLAAIGCVLNYATEVLRQQREEALDSLANAYVTKDVS